MKRTSPTLLALLWLGTAAVAQEPMAVREGRAAAEAYCARCHDIEPGGAFKQYPPSFRAIAAYMAPEIIRLKITQPEHNAIMPDFSTFINQTELQDIVDYITSLEP